MTDEYIPRGDPLPLGELYPNTPREKRTVARMQKLLMSKGMLEGTAYETAVQLWRMIRRG